jgi:hypothetical protein
MITGNIKSQIDQIWNACWSGGISNPLEVIEQITYLHFLRRLDDLRWSRFKHFAPGDMYGGGGEHVFPFLRNELARNHGGDDSTYAHHMKDARFTIPTPALLAKVVDLLDAVPMEDRDTKGDLYEYMLGKIASAGQNGQFRTPRHIIRLMVELTAPQPTDVICDPACGTAGFPVTAGEYQRERPRTAQSFCVPKADIAAQGYDLSLNRYKEVVHKAVEHRAPNPDFVGRCALFESRRVLSEGLEPDKFIYASYLIRARVQHEGVKPAFLRDYLLGAEGRRQLRAGCKTSAGQYNINTEGLGAVAVPVPAYNLQREYGERVEAIERLRTFHGRSIGEVDSLVSSLQHRAFRGEL